VRSRNEVDDLQRAELAHAEGTLAIGDDDEAQRARVGGRLAAVAEPCDAYAYRFHPFGEYGGDGDRGTAIVTAPDHEFAFAGARRELPTTWAGIDAAWPQQALDVPAGVDVLGCAEEEAQVLGLPSRRRDDSRAPLTRKVRGDGSDGLGPGLGGPARRRRDRAVPCRRAGGVPSARPMLLGFAAHAFLELALARFPP
jgi:hypothetical protein